MAVPGQTYVVGWQRTIEDTYRRQYAGFAPAKAKTPTDPASLTPEQLANAKSIIATGRKLGVPPRAIVIALATAAQESTLRNLAGGDRDSIGLFQQRPSQGWGTPAQVHDPEYAATQFYQRLLKVKNWQNLPLTVAAQRVQRSGLPDAYAKWEPLATNIYKQYGG